MIKIGSNGIRMISREKLHPNGARNYEEVTFIGWLFRVLFSSLKSIWYTFPTKSPIRTVFSSDSNSTVDKCILSNALTLEDWIF